MIAREGIPFILIGLVATLFLLWASTRFDSKVIFATAVVFGLLTLFTVFFFRDPFRTFAEAPDILISPADGKVIAIEHGTEHPFIGGDYQKLSIFLSVFDVHVNRIPASGVVDFVKYNPGKFFAAFQEKASTQNEQTEIGMTTAHGRKLVFKQIAGLVARRIVCNLEAGDTVTAGERFGLIRFGSRTELFLPADAELEVQIGDHVVGGKTVVGYLRSITNPGPASSVESSSERL